MADTKTHYDQFLAPLYSWMSGDFNAAVTKEEAFLVKVVKSNKAIAKAVDLGCGHGIHSVALAKLGYQVEGVDLCAALLEELKKNKGTFNIKPINKDMRTYRPLQPVDVAVCMGDSLAHLDSMEEVNKFCAHLHTMIKPGGQCVVSYRDFTADAKGSTRVVMVKADQDRILDTFLVFGATTVDVTDILHQKSAQGWSMTSSTYRKIKFTNDAVVKAFRDNGFTQVLNETADGIVRICFRA